MSELQEEFSKLSLHNVANGAAGELFDKAMNEVLDNILDDNREATEARKITLTFEVKANRERNMAVISVQSATKLAPVQVAAATLFLRVEKGKGKAYTHNIHQPSLFPNENVRPLRTEAE